jgi:hypothetical protein
MTLPASGCVLVIDLVHAIGLLLSFVAMRSGLALAVLNSAELASFLSFQ